MVGSGLIDNRQLFGTPTEMFMDPVHGSIWLHRCETEIIDRPLFQRLRWITQNDVTSLVFPGAVHSRFLHSLGALHIVDRLWRRLVAHYISGRVAESRLTPEHLGAINYVGGCLRLAALLHDAGHFPFSHLLERDSQRFRELLCSSVVFDRLSAVVGRPLSTGYDTIDHEAFSLACAAQLLDDNPTPFAREDVLALISPGVFDVSDQFTNSVWTLLSMLIPTLEADLAPNRDLVIKEFVALLNSFISGPLDVDKMDYLLRDSYFTGVRYGVYNLDHLLSTIRIGFQVSAEKSWLGLAISERGLPALEDFTFSRFQLYQAVYSHKTVVGFKLLLLRCIDEALEEPEFRERISASLTDLTEFVHFTESYLWEELRKQAKRSPNSSASRLLRHEHPRYLTTTVNKTDVENDQMLNELAAAGQRAVKKDVSITFFEQRSDGVPAIMVLVKDPKQNRHRLASLETQTSFFTVLGRKRITHFFNLGASN
jgi:HD superfamily phosphohydrolase